MILSFQSNQTGAPQLTGQPGTLVAVLNACLINGYNLRTLTTITQTGGVATATADSGHGLRENDIVRINGAGIAAYNGDMRIRNVTTTTFQYDVAANAATPAGGQATVKIAPLDWTGPFTATNKAVYRASDPTGNRLWLRVDDNSLAGDANLGRGGRSASAQMWESMTDIDTGIGKSEVYWRKAQNETTTARPWLLVGDTKRFWLLVNWSESYPNRYVAYGFGDLPSFKAGDAYGSLLVGYADLAPNGGDPAAFQFADVIQPIGSSVGNSTGILLARPYTLLGGKTNAQWVGAPAYVVTNGFIGLGATALPCPNPADNGLYVMPMLVQEAGGPSLRGRVPGLLCPLHAIPAAEPIRYPGFIIDGTPREMLLVAGVYGAGSARLAFDLTGPWE